MRGRPRKDMKPIIDREREQNAKLFANKIINEHKTIRQIASETGISKSTVHVYLKRYVDSPSIKSKLDKTLTENFNTKHIHGGEATKKKYENKSKKKKKK